MVKNDKASADYFDKVKVSQAVARYAVLIVINAVIVQSGLSNQVVIITI